MKRSRTFIAAPPGETIKELLIDRNMTQKEFAARMNMSQKHISHLINGDVQLTAEMAERLEMVLGMPAHFWSNLEIIYREKLIKVQMENEMDADIEMLKDIPYSEMAEKGWVPDTTSKTEMVINLRKYFEVVSLGLLNEPNLIGLPEISCVKEDSLKYSALSEAQQAIITARNNISG